MVRPVSNSVVAPRIAAPIVSALQSAKKVAATPASSFTAATRSTGPALDGASARPVSLPSLALGSAPKDPIAKESDAIAKEMFLGKFKDEGGGDGEVWRNYESGSVDGDVLGRIRGVWMNGAPWSKDATFIPKSVVDQVMKHHLSSFIGSRKDGDKTIFTFMGGAVELDKAGKTHVAKEPLQFSADPIAKELGLGSYKTSAGGDGEVWRTYQKGTVDGDMFGDVRGVWFGAKQPWGGGTFISNDAIGTVMKNHLGAFQSATKNGDATVLKFAKGTVTVDKDGKVTGSTAA
jgi:hypothetical protein